MSLVVTLAWYMIDSLRHWPFMGQFSWFLQLHNFFLLPSVLLVHLFLSMVFLLCPSIIFFMLGMQHRYRNTRLLTHTKRRWGQHDKSKMAVQEGRKTIDSITKMRFFAVFAVALFLNLSNQVLWERETCREDFEHIFA